MFASWRGLRLGGTTWDADRHLLRHSGLVYLYLNLHRNLFFRDVKLPTASRPKFLLDYHLCCSLGYSAEDSFSMIFSNKASVSDRTVDFSTTEKQNSQ